MAGGRQRGAGELRNLARISYMSGFDDKPDERTHGWREKLESSSTGSGSI
jgi:hypothetical protein